MRFNMGCGHSALPGWVNVDKFPSPAVDQLVDLEVLPWPWADDCADAVRFCHSLEHMGATTPLFLGIIKELWRICRDGAALDIMVPHPRHDYFLGDPTHVRPITWEVLECFDQEKNRQRIASGAANTPLGLQLGVNFRISKVTYTLEAPWRERLNSGELSHDQLEFHARHNNNVISEAHIELAAVKAPSAPAP